MSSSLLDRLVEHDAEAWRRTVRLYYPLVRDWCQRGGLQSEDAADVAQEVFRALAGSVGRFEREGGKNSFRGWLYGITQRQLMAHRRRQRKEPAAAGGSEAQQWFADVPDEDFDGGSSTSSLAAPDDRHEVLRRALQLLREGVAERTWQAFWRSAVQGHAPAHIAADLGMSVNAVYIAKARMLARLREEFGDLID
ncbi:MAG TPA: sigma-70 family RNA polymerase sigma factor [Pirellulales bacterium]|nr:sigma-70 family RNA polymerase sigma factor [Pirellulales bacterium]